MPGYNPIISTGSDIDLDLLSTLFLKLDGTNSPMTGQLKMDENAIILRDTNGVDWALTIDTDGTPTTTEVIYADSYLLLENNNTFTLEDGTGYIALE